jgi:Uma2 family endonuclease
MGDPVERSSYEAYLALERDAEHRYEFVDGVVYAMAGGTPEHSRLAINVASELRTALAGQGYAVYGSDLKIRIDATNRTTYADVVVICGPEVTSKIDANAITNPTVIIEVLSPSTEASDRGEKWHHYQRLGSLREYVLVSQGEPYVEVFRREGEEWVLRTFVAGQSLELPSQGARVSVDAIYADPRVPPR